MVGMPTVTCMGGWKKYLRIGTRIPEMSTPGFSPVHAACTLESLMTMVAAVSSLLGGLFVLTGSIVMVLAQQVVNT